MSKTLPTLTEVTGWKGKFWFGSDHSYWWKETSESDPRPLSGVTSVLNIIAKPALIQWAANCAVDAIIAGMSHEEARKAHMRKKDAAATKGTDAHALIEDYIKACIVANAGVPIEVHSSPEPRVIEFADMARKEGLTFVASEKPLADPKLSLGGTPDFIATRDGKLVIGDLKTGKGIYDRTYFAQMAAYGYMWMKAKRQKESPGLLIVHAPSQKPEQPIAVYWSEDWEGDWQAFQAALTLHRWKDNFIRPKYRP